MIILKLYTSTHRCILDCKNKGEEEEEEILYHL